MKITMEMLADLESCELCGAIYVRSDPRHPKWPHLNRPGGAPTPSPPARTSDFATPREVAVYLKTTPERLAQQRHHGTGPKFVKDNRRVLYRWADVDGYYSGRTFDDTSTLERFGDRPTNQQLPKRAADIERVLGKHTPDQQNGDQS